jgi:hypothetical protein
LSININWLSKTDITFPLTSILYTFSSILDKY